MLAQNLPIKKDAWLFTTHLSVKKCRAIYLVLPVLRQDRNFISAKPLLMIRSGVHCTVLRVCGGNREFPQLGCASPLDGATVAVARLVSVASDDS
jgi:hypothetical protein